MCVCLCAIFLFVRVYLYVCLCLCTIFYVSIFVCIYVCVYVYYFLFVHVYLYVCLCIFYVFISVCLSFLYVSIYLSVSDNNSTHICVCDEEEGRCRSTDKRMCVCTCVFLSTNRYDGLIFFKYFFIVSIFMIDSYSLFRLMDRIRVTRWQLKDVRLFYTFFGSTIVNV